MDASQAGRDFRRDDPEVSNSSVEDLGGVERESTFDQRLADQENERLSDLLENSQDFRREIQTGSSRIPALTDVEKEQAVGDSQFIATPRISNVTGSTGPSTGSTPTGTVTGTSDTGTSSSDTLKDLTGTEFPSLLP